MSSFSRHTSDFSTPDQRLLLVLSKLHFLLAGLLVLLGSLPIINLIMGLLGLISMLAQWSTDIGMSLVSLGVTFILLPILCIMLSWGSALLLLVAGQRLRQQRSRTVCLVVAAVSCWFLPLGTMLGVYTIIVLCRPSVRSLFSESGRFAA